MSCFLMHITECRDHRDVLEPDDHRQNQTTVLEPDDRPRTRRPSPEPDDRRQNQTTVTRTRTRTRRRPIERPASEHYERFNQLID